MKNVIKNVIEREEFELTDILKKIDNCWLKGFLSEEEKVGLSALAQSKAKPSNSINVIAKLSELEQRIKALEENDVPNNEATNEYPPFEVGKWYYAGNKMTFEGRRYKCIAPEGNVCVWSPKDHPAYWEVVTE